MDYGTYKEFERVWEIIAELKNELEVHKEHIAILTNGKKVDKDIPKPEKKKDVLVRKGVTI